MDNSIYWNKYRKWDLWLNLKNNERRHALNPVSFGLCLYSYTIYIFLFFPSSLEAEIAAAAIQPLPDDDDDTFE